MIEADLARLGRPEGAPFDLVVVGYALTEIADAVLPTLIDALWALTSGALAIVEPGTPRDYARLMAVRERLVAQARRRPGALPARGALSRWPRPTGVISPCALPRSRDHKLLKAPTRPSRTRNSPISSSRAGRTFGARRACIAPPRAGKAGISLKLCTDKGICDLFIPKRDKPRYERFCKKDWGDPLRAPAEDIE